jgi:hypothetical protein
VRHIRPVRTRKTQSINDLKPFGLVVRNSETRRAWEKEYERRKRETLKAQAKYEHFLNSKKHKQYVETHKTR